MDEPRYWQDGLLWNFGELNQAHCQISETQGDRSSGEHNCRNAVDKQQEKTAGGVGDVSANRPKADWQSPIANLQLATK